ncbi:hypothetical protein WA577_001511, partial [Blastocystis sp. JDR]
MCSSVLSTYQSILKETEIEILRRIVNLDSDSRRVLYAMYMRKTKYFFCLKCRVQVPHLSDCVVHLLRENLVKPCDVQDLLPLLNEMPLKDLLSLAKTVHVDSLLPAKDNTSRDSVMELFKVMIKQPQYGSLSNSQRLLNSIASLFGTPLLIQESVYELLLYVHILYNPFNA